MSFQIFPKTFPLYQQGLTEKYSRIRGGGKKTKETEENVFKN